MLQTQSTLKTTAHGGRNEGGGVADDICGMTDRDRADLRGSQGSERQPMELRDTAGTGGLVGATVTSIRGETRAPEA